MDVEFDYLHASKQQLIEELQRRRVQYEATFTLQQLRRLYIEHVVGANGDNPPAVNAPVEQAENAQNEQIGNQERGPDGVAAEDVPIENLRAEIERMALQQQRQEMEMRALRLERDQLQLERERLQLQQQVGELRGAMPMGIHPNFQQFVPPQQPRKQTFDDIKHMTAFTGDDAYGVKKFLKTSK